MALDSPISNIEDIIEDARQGRPYVLVDAEEGLSKAGDAIGSRQPPREERERYQTVTGQIDEATGLVSTARIAVVDHETSRYVALADRLSDAAGALQGLESDLEHPPEDG